MIDSVLSNPPDGQANISVIASLQREHAALEHSRFSPNHGNALSLCFHAIPDAKPLRTFAGIALGGSGQNDGDREQQGTHPFEMAKQGRPAGRLAWIWQIIKADGCHP